MPSVKAGPNQYLLVGRKGTLENRGSAVSAFLRPGTIFVLVPSTKQEAAFEFTQETKDGIPLRFKGIVIYRITDPVAAARMFDFSSRGGAERISTLLTHICLGELRHAVSHMTMAECIEQRKTTLSGVVETALHATVHGDDAQTSDWGIEVEVARVAQVFIVDPELRQQLEAEVRNEIKLKSDQSSIRSQEEIRLAELASEGRVQEKKLATDRDSLRRQEEMELAQLARQRRMQAENLATDQQALGLEQERLHSQLAAEQDRVNAEAPVRLLRIATESGILREELELRKLQNQVKAFDVEADLLLDRARQALRLEMLPVEQAPRMVEAASRVLRGTNLSIYGEDGHLLNQIAPIFELLTRSVQQATQGAGHRASGPDAPG
ncbi:MAG: SPFH domain-containing protein [Chloroflexi bacterium]|nr:SPFH domain-containing protein [Chloroflexota bacterium]